VEGTKLVPSESYCASMIRGFLGDSSFIIFLLYFLFHSYCIIKLWYVFCCRLCDPGLVEAYVGPDGGAKKRMQLDWGEESVFIVCHAVRSVAATRRELGAVH
jgi:hypothetical protein